MTEAKRRIRDMLEDEEIWPANDEQERVLADKPAVVPHFLCVADDEADRYTDEPEQRLAEEADQDAEPSEEQLDDALPVAEEPPVDDSPINQMPQLLPPKHFTPVSPHMHRIMTRRQNKPARQTGHQPPDWVLDTYGEEPRSSMWKGVAIAACLFAATGVGITVTAMEFKDRAQSPVENWNMSLAQLWPSFKPPEKPELKRLDVVEEKPVEPVKPVAPSSKQAAAKRAKIASVSLSVEDTRGVPQSPIPLSVNTKTDAQGAPIVVKLSGLPQQATLSAGKKQADATWLVQPRELDDLRLTLPSGDKKPLKVTVAAVETETGELAAPMQEFTVSLDPNAVKVEPAALQISNSPNFSEAAPKVAPPVINQAALDLRKRGDETLALGDVSGARAFYKKALQMGDILAAARIGRTYDPTVYEAVGVHGLEPDRKMAEHWYRHGIERGDATAKEELTRLQAFRATQ